MSLSAGESLGPYEIVEPIGSGGMGEVYRARDVRLDRSVAIKVLSGEVAANPTRHERLKREAKAISKLNHPNVCALLDVGEQDGTYFLVLEHLEGKTLAERLESGRLPLKDALRIGAEVADGLAAAHARGIVHRDLKPGNIILASTGAKILDFGLAREDPPGGEDEDAIGTVSRALTSEGVAVGTPSYMSPEQVLGQKADARSDLFALGVVLYEMISGKRPFRGETVSSLAASILKEDPGSLTDLVPDCPPRVAHLVERCLVKDPSTRWQSALDLASELRFADTSSAATPARASRWVPWALGVLGIAAAFLWNRDTKPLEIHTLTVAAPPGTFFVGAAPGLSPDGRYFAFVAGKDVETARLWIRNIASGETRDLADANYLSVPSFSPDGRHLLFTHGGQLRSISMATGLESVVRDGVVRGASQNAEGQVLFVPNSRSPLYVGDIEGGEARAVTELDTEAGEISHRHAQFLPDGHHFIFINVSRTADHAVYLGSLSEGKLDRLVNSTSPAVYADGHLFYAKDDVLLAQRFDARTLTLSDAPRPVARGPQEMVTHPFNAAVSRSGVLAYGIEPRAWSRDRRLVWYDRDGNSLNDVGGTEAFAEIALAPDGERVAVGIAKRSEVDIWLMDLRGVRTRLASSPVNEFCPVWSPSGDTIVFNSDRAGGTRDLYVAKIDGPAELLLTREENLWPSDWDSSGRVWFSSQKADSQDHDVWYWKDGEAKPFLVTPYSERDARVSPDGAWLAFVSDESGREEIYLQPLERAGERRRVSHEGGYAPQWRGDGAELFYVDGSSTIMSVAVREAYAGDALPDALFTTRVDRSLGQGDYMYAVTSDGQRFLVNVAPERPPSFEYTVLLDWRRALSDS